MFRKISTVFLLLSVLAVCMAVSVTAQDTLPTTKEAWIEKLSGLSLQNVNGYQALQQFAAQDPELTYAVLRDGWTKIKDTNARSQIINAFLHGSGQIIVNGVERNPYTPNPHLLDILGLIMQVEQVPSQENKPDNRAAFERQQIQQELLGIAFREITGPEEFKQWKDSLGDKPLKAVILENSRRVVNDLQNGDAVQRMKTLELLRKISYYSGTSTSSINGVTKRSHTASGLMKIRRDALIEANLPGALGRLLRPENPQTVREDSLKVLARFRPEDDVLAPFESDMKRELPPLLEKPAETPDRRTPFYQPDNLAELLTAYSGDWAVDLIARLLQKSAESKTPDFALVNAVQGFHNPRLIPTLIGLLEAVDTARPGFNPYDNTLRQLTQIPWNGSMADREHDGLWWRIWWHDNKKRYSPEVQKVSIPRFHKANKEGSSPSLAAVSRRRVERALISEDPKRSYWLLSPGWTPSSTLTENEKAAIANSGLKKLEAVKPDRPGLLVVLLDGDTSDDSLLDSWLDVSDALDRRYYLAIAVRPRWNEKSANHWLTRKDRAEVPGAAFTTEAFAEQIVRQMALNAAIDPDHVFLVANGQAGTAAYACALQKETVFRGFCLLSAPFRSALLPPLSAAKKRRFFLALGMEGQGGADTLAVAAESLLKQQGAQVQAEQIKSGSLVEGIQHAVRWLER